MRLTAALTVGAFVYLLVGQLVGVTPAALRREAPRRRLLARGQDWLNQAGVGVSPIQFVAASFGAGVAFGILVAAFTGVGAIGLAAGLGVALMPRTVFARRGRQARADRLAAWPDALRDVVAHLRASMTIHASLTELGRTGPPALRTSFDRYEKLSEALDHKSALEVVREELADPLSDRIIEIMLVAYDQGTTVIVDILEGLATSTTRDLNLLEEVETAQLETRLEARGAAVLPLVVLGLLCASTPGYRAFYSTGAGWLVIGFGCVMSLIGLVVIGRLGKAPTEARILAGSES